MGSCFGFTRPITYRPIFHATKPGAGWEVKVRFRLDPEEMIEILSKKKKPKPSELKELKKLTEEHRVALLIEWETKVIRGEPGPDR
jgi:hypothetical protein